MTLQDILMQLSSLSPMDLHVLSTAINKLTGSVAPSEREMFTWGSGDYAGATQEYSARIGCSLAKAAEAFGYKPSR